jgi:NADH:ubiquinone oxidoreductase subunit 6 (subunit J)
MTVADAFFYLFAALTVVSAVMVILARNPVHAVLWLILSFFNAAGLFVLLGAEFLAMILVVVYVGAVAVLFLFVVMMLDVDFAALRAGFIRNAPLGFIIGAIVLTLHHKVGVRRQDIAAQNARHPATAIDIVQVPSGGFTVPEKSAAKETV